jgi:hypothetical protein
MSVLLRAALPAGLALLALAAVLPAQGVGTAIDPVHGTVGDVFHATVTVDVRSGERVALPDSLPLSGDLEVAGRPTLRESELPGGGRRVVATYPFTAWRPGTHTLPPAALRVGPDGATQTVPFRFPELEITSVLPADTAGIEPMGVRDVLGGERVLWPWLLAAAALLLALIGIVLWLRRRRRGATAPMIFVRPAVRALDRLDARRGIVLAQSRAYYTLYDELSQALREYVAAIEPSLDATLTSAELAGRSTDRLDADAAPLHELLGNADLVRFARAAPSQDRALRDWADARAWVQRVDEIRLARERAAAEAAARAEAAAGKEAA